MGLLHWSKKRSKVRMIDLPNPSTPSRALIFAAFAAVYTIWGSTYLAIRFAVEVLPPFLMVGTRFLIAGFILYLWARIGGASRPDLSQWKSAAIVGLLMLVLANGLISWSEQRIPSGLAALTGSDGSLLDGDTGLDAAPRHGAQWQSGSGSYHWVCGSCAVVSTVAFDQKEASSISWVLPWLWLQPFPGPQGLFIQCMPNFLPLQYSRWEWKCFLEG